MNKINFCIVLYNKKLEDSLSLTSLICFFKKYNILGDVVVFNNGPEVVEEINLEYVICNQLLVNASLSKIYNKFIQEYPADFFVFLDDDTCLNKDYLNELRLNTEDILVFRFL